MPYRIARCLLALSFVTLTALSVAASAPNAVPQTIPKTPDGVAAAIRLVGERIRFGEAVVVEGRREAQSVIVDFSSPVSDTIVKDGRKSVKPLATVTFTTDGPRVRWLGETFWKAPGKKEAEERAALARAVAAAFEHLSSDAHTKGRFTYPTSFEAKVRRTDAGFSVFVQTIPYMPGGHTGVELKPNYVIRGVMPGA